MNDLADTPVIVLNWNGWDVTFACLRSLREHGGGCQVWLVDNGSCDDRRAEAAALYPGLRTFRWDSNYGWAGGYNGALRVALREGYTYAYLLNNDCLVTSGFLQEVLDVASSTPHAAAIGSYILYASAPRWLQFDGQPRDVGQRAVGDGIFTRETSRLSGAGMLVRLNAVDELGPFDERLFCYWDDTEWCARARRAGWQLMMAGGSLILHESNGSDVNFNALYYLYRNRYLVRGHPELRLTPGREVRYVCGSLRFAGQLRRANRTAESKAIVAGLWDGWTGKTGARRGDPPAPVVFILSHLWP
jgi:GT2 family glycosyltransferase